MKSSTSWKKGQSANPGGRPKEYFGTKDYARKKSEWAFKRLEEIARQNENLNAAYQATMGMLAYGIGKPVQHVDLSNTDGTLAGAWAAARKEMQSEEREEAGVTH